MAHSPQKPFDEHCGHYHHGHLNQVDNDLAYLLPQWFGHDCTSSSPAAAGGDVRGRKQKAPGGHSSRGSRHTSAVGLSTYYYGAEEADRLLKFAGGTAHFGGCGGHNYGASSRPSCSWFGAVHRGLPAAAGPPELSSPVIRRRFSQRRPFEQPFSFCARLEGVALRANVIRIGCSKKRLPISRGSSPEPDYSAAVCGTAKFLQSLGHSVETSCPAALEEATLPSGVAAATAQV
jgi:hypothetical protein